MEKRKRVYVPKQLYDKLEEIAKTKNVSVSEYAEALLEGSI
jgi:hypothetical protein